MSAALRGPDLAQGKPWRTSSALDDCPLGRTQRCLGNHLVELLFHTQTEASPWMEIDLGEPTRLSQVWVHNRKDCCQERAVPLVVEAGDDGRSFRELARVDEPFRKNVIKFPATRARYVRLRVDRPSALHLAGVEIYR
jgi:hypothetical protein